MKEVKVAKELKQTLLEEKRALQLVRDTIVLREARAIQVSIEAAEKLGLGDSSDVLEGKKVISRINDERVLRDQVVAAVRKRDRGDLSAVLAKAFEMDLDIEEVWEAQALLSRIIEEQNCLEHLRAAIDSKSIEGLGAWLAKSTELGITSEDIVIARRLNESLLAHLACKNGLKVAIQSRDILVLRNAITKAGSVSLPETIEEYKEAVDLFDLLTKQNNVLTSLNMAVKMKFISDIKEQLELAGCLGMTSETFKEIEAANKVLKFLHDEEDVINELKKAVTLKEEASLRAAISSAETLGLSFSSPCLIEAMNCLAVIGNRGKMHNRLISCMNKDDVSPADLESIIKEASTCDGHEDLEEDIKNAKSKLEKLSLEGALMDKLLAAVNMGDVDAVSDLLTSSKDISVTNIKYTSIVERANSLLDSRNIYDKTRRAVSISVANKNLEAVKDTLSTSGITMDKLDAATVQKIKQLEKEVEISAAIEAKILIKDLTALEELVSSAKALQIDNAKVQEGRIICARVKAIDVIKEKLKRAVSERNLSNLSHALEEATSMALSENEMEQAKMMR